MTVSSSTPQVEEAWIAVQFQLAALTAEFEGEVPDVVGNVRDEAYAAINGEFRGLPSMYRSDGPVEVEVPVCDICAIDEDLVESQGRLVVAITFVSGDDFTGEVIAALKTLCIEQFAAAAEAHGIACIFAGIEGWRRLSYIEHAVIEAA
jgi:hypothetical protein